MAGQETPSLRVFHVFPTFVIGGAQRRFAQIANASGRRLNHTVLATDDRYEASQLLDAGTTITIAERVPAAGNLVTRVGHYRRRLIAARPDLLVTYNWGAIEWALAGRLCGLPHIHAEDGFSRAEADRQLWRRVMFRRLVLGELTTIVVPSKTLESVVLDQWRFPPRQVRYIPNGIDLSGKPWDLSLASRAEFGLPARAPLVGWIGALRPEKNLRRLIRAVARASGDAVLVLIGEGPERGAVCEEAREQRLEERVRMLGERKDIDRILPLFDLFALSSDTEQMPMVVLEAMAAGLAIASVEVGDVRRMVCPANQPYVAGRTEEALGHSISRLLSSRTDREQAGRGNLRRVKEDFRADRMIEAYFQLFEAVAAGSRRRGQE